MEEGLTTLFHFLFPTLMTTPASCGAVSFRLKTGNSPTFILRHTNPLRGSQVAYI